MYLEQIGGVKLSNNVYFVKTLNGGANITLECSNEPGLKNYTIYIYFDKTNVTIKDKNWLESRNKLISFLNEIYI